MSSSWCWERSCSKNNNNKKSYREIWDFYQFLLLLFIFHFTHSHISLNDRKIYCLSIDLKTMSVWEGEMDDSNVCMLLKYFYRPPTLEKLENSMRDELLNKTFLFLLVFAFSITFLIHPSYHTIKLNIDRVDLRDENLWKKGKWGVRLPDAWRRHLSYNFSLSLSSFPSISEGNIIKRWLFAFQVCLIRNLLLFFYFFEEFDRFF